ncbi:exodeoxyribonuclease VII large subunit [Neptunomonas phycophila]|uniref:exodeoxyribonuclease VII large subunit n=1 Tax=Neptunomonas phycophila TaxID=1572645 RepID=UPI0026E468C7|nr:exodeoxyribonuclease VII large subunit [Neptunomonas phycophila]MDO6782627.1 exodeoxyribonuclease VII large subunit [Neptunomonas phycophila]
MQSTINRQKTALTVSQLNREAKSLLESSFFQIRVLGELSSFSRPASGHWYFTLKDDRAQVRCAMFRNRNMSVRFSPKEGDQVIITGKVSLYEGRGDFQLIVDSMESDGEGKLQQAFEALKAKLSSEGLFSSAHKKSIPAHPNHLAVITSPTGAAVHDILSVLKRRFPSLPITIYPSVVQGSEAPQQLIQALQAAIHHQTADLIIIGRGGGSLEDLWPFNDEALARAIFDCPIPIISAVGHEVDFSISDLVADLRAPTPSAAAELISPDQDALRIQIDRLSARLERQLRISLNQRQDQLNALKKRLRHPGERLREQRSRLNFAEKRLHALIQKQLTKARYQTDIAARQLERHHPARQIEHMRERLNRADEKLRRAMVNQTDRQRYQLGNLLTRLNAVNPLATLERGYAIVQAVDVDKRSPSGVANGPVITHANDVKIGDQVINRLRHGNLICRVETINSQESINSDEAIPSSNNLNSPANTVRKDKEPS